MRLPNLFNRERIATVAQFRDLERNPHIYIITNKRVVEIDYDNNQKQTVVATLKQIKAAKPATPEENNNG